MQILEKAIDVSAPEEYRGLLKHIQSSVSLNLKPGEVPVRFVITESDANRLHCELGVMSGLPAPISDQAADIFGLRKRQVESTSSFNAAMLVPTGIGAEIGGHAGDATAVARMLAESCDKLIIHPNVVNASDINELPSNALYVEGSIITRLLMGVIGLMPTRSNRILVIIDNHLDKHFVHAAINSVNAARATYGLNVPEVICLNPPVRMFAEYSDSGRAAGRVDNIVGCLEVLGEAQGSFDAVALASVIRVPHEYHADYFQSEGEMVNPWGGVEAILTHAISSLVDMPTAHSPMFESRSIENLEVGIVEPRMSAEAVSMTFLNCILKGLHKSPKIVRDESLFARSDVLTVEDISCLIIPAGCLGLPTIAALEQGIPVIAVRENANLMRNDLELLPWKDGQLIRVESYLEAVGVMNAIKAGVTLESVRRPINKAIVSNRDQSEKHEMSNKSA